MRRATMSNANSSSNVPQTVAASRAVWMATGGVLGALAASTCCILPLVLFSAGAGGAWLGQLTALSVYQPIFIGVAVLFLAYGFKLVYVNVGSRDNDASCARPLPSRLVKTTLWSALSLVLMAAFWPLIVPLILR